MEDTFRPLYDIARFMREASHFAAPPLPARLAQMKLSAIVFAVALVTSSPALAQSGPVGIGFAQAAEGSWWCRNEDPGKGLACAMDKCQEEARGQECHPTRWCLPAGWSGLMTVWLPEFHNTIVLCGTSGEAALVAALEALCDDSPFVTRCTPFAMIDPDGNERSIEGLDWLGPAVRQDGANDPATEQPGADVPP